MISKAEGDVTLTQKRMAGFHILPKLRLSRVGEIFIIGGVSMCEYIEAPATTPPFPPHPPTTRAYVSHDLEEWAFSVNGLDVGKGRERAGEKNISEKRKIEGSYVTGCEGVREPEGERGLAWGWFFSCQGYARESIIMGVEGSEFKSCEVEIC